MNCGNCGAPALQQNGQWVCSQLCGWSSGFAPAPAWKTLTASVPANK
jgi:hypothetical protein